MKKKTKKLLHSALIKATRTFLQAGLPGVIAAGTNFIDVAIWKPAVLAGVAAVIALVWRWADGTSLPSLSDPYDKVN